MGREPVRPLPGGVSRAAVGPLHRPRPAQDRRGRIDPADTHPFAREFAGREYCFAHNGTLEGFKSLALGRFHPLGQTDSEHAFCHLLDDLATRDRGLDGEADWRWLHARLATLNRLGKLNCLLSDGVRLFVYHDLGGWKGLNFRLVRMGAGEARRLSDEEFAIQLDGTTSNRGIVVATRPLCRSGWHAIRTGELMVLERGAVRFSSARARHSPEFEPSTAVPVGPRG